MTAFANALAKLGAFGEVFDYQLIRASMVIMFFFYGYQKWFEFLATLTIIPFMPDGWAVSAGGFPAMNANVAFVMKDIVILAASVYLLRQDALRVLRGSERSKAGQQWAGFNSGNALRTRN